jgi:nitrogen fixation/metabolism regulation signal transduction histidine kinase
VVVSLFANPLVLRAVVGFFASGAAFVFAIWLMRALRRNIAAEADIDSAAASKIEALPLHLYNTVIQQLKQQKHELQLQNQAEQRRTRTTENFSQAVLSNLSSGVLVFGPNGLVKQANAAAKRILGFNSPSGMSAEDIFRSAPVCSPEASSISPAPHFAGKLSEEIHAVLREGSKCRSVEADYTTPAGQTVRVAVTVSPVAASDGSLIGVACLISDRSEVEQIRHQQELQGEVSAEMALDLRSSLTTISGYAQQLAINRDPEMASQLAADIASEAARLDRHIGGFLAASRKSDDKRIRVRAAGRDV